MKVTMQVPSITPLNTFFDYLKRVATDKVHEDNVDLIADFVDKVLVVEMKRLENNVETFEQVIEIPDCVIVEPLQRAKKQFDDFFTKFLTDRGAPVKEDPVTDNTGIPYHPISYPQPEQVLPGQGENDPVPSASAFVKARSGNGHKVAKIRSLFGNEKDTIRSEFLNLNGQISEDACKPIHASLDKEVSIFQVTGFVTYLHSLIAGGALEVRDMPAYLNFIQGHRALWAKWNSPKYQAMRAAAKV
ncbi:MAG: hypothetical protein NT096_00295 [Proteobacteria bacterium]|nr:hypothetical protein [Pseudomonadota bacterium]